MTSTTQSIGADEWSPDVSSNLVELLQMRAATQADDTAYIFLEDGEKEGSRLTFSQLDRRAKAIASQLQASELEGRRALLLYPPGLDYIEAFFGCLYAGVIAVPAYPPSGRHLERLQSIFRDSTPANIMTVSSLRERFGAEALQKLGAGGCHWTLSDCVGASEGAWRPIEIEPDRVAFLQYTSGSTSAPRGVMVSHRNLIANQALIKDRFGHDSGSTLVGWLPLYHDMGLIGNILQPLYVGATAILMSPMAFLEKPIRWLRAISSYRAHTSGGPNFAFDLCVRKVSSREKQDLDLRHWAIAFSGAEPVRAVTLDRFAAAFAECGFVREAFFPCYGLAEATLVVTSPSRGRCPPLRTAPVVACGEGERATGAGGEDAPIVGCGRAWTGHEVVILDPQTMRRRADREVGEIWVRGPSVALGYWRQESATEDVFGARIVDEESSTFLRTGDLGFLEKGELYVTGRLKDLIIVGGRNYYPQDFESLAEEIDDVRPGCVAAFSVMIADREAFVMVVEPRRSLLTAPRDKGRLQELICAIRDRLADACDITPAEIILAAPGTIPKTSSGKIRRGECRRLYLEGNLQIVARENESGPASASGYQAPKQAPSTDDLLREAIALLPSAKRATLITRFLLSTAAGLLNIPEGELGADASMRRCGLDSLRLVELKHAVDHVVGLDVPLSLLLADVTFAQAAAAIVEASSEREHFDSTLEPGDDGELSQTQRAIWAVHELDLSSIAYNLHLALKISGELDVEALRFGLFDVLERHPILRGAFRVECDTVIQSTMQLSEIAETFHLVEAEDWTEAALRGDMTSRIARPFALRSGITPRATLYRRGSVAILLLCAHHIAIDLWSLLVLLEDLRVAYAARRHGTTPSFGPLGADYRAFVQSQRRYLRSPAAERDWEYWRSRLGADLPVLALPLDHPRPIEPDYLGASVHSRLDRALSRKLDALARTNGATLFSLLLAAYQVLLYRYTNQSDIVVGTASSGRSRREFAGVVGNFVNPLALRSRIVPQTPFVDYLREVQNHVSEALAHQEFPFAQLVERLQPERHAGQWPIFQTWFTLQQAQSEVESDFAQLALGGESDSLPWGDLTIAGLPVETHIERFDLKLVAARTKSGLALAFQYREALFRPATICRLAEEFAALLEAIVADPNKSVGCLPPFGRVKGPSPEELAPNSQAPFIHDLVSTWAGQSPDAFAIIGSDRSYTYGELESESNRIARFLREVGVVKDEPVGVCVERSAITVSTIVAILKAGAAYLPIEPDLPPERIAMMLRTAGARRLICRTDWFAKSDPGRIEPIFLDDHAAEIAAKASCAMETATSGDNLAYVIFTSGSSGQPKGVAVTHGNLINYTRAIMLRLGGDCGLHFALASTLAADLGHTSLFPALASGGCVHVLSGDQATDPLAFQDYFSQQRIDVLKIVPSHYQALLSSEGGGEPLPRKAILFGGERLPVSLARRIHDIGGACAIFNHYGPTETTVGALVFPVEGRWLDPASVDHLPIGEAIGAVRVYVLGRDLVHALDGVNGEICLAGAGLARGYIGRPDLTAERFIPDPYGPPGGRLYRTGDLGRIGDGGVVTFLGRIDQQVKIRGYRVELAEIELRLLECEGVAQAVVTTYEAAPGQTRLIAYVAGPRDAALAVDAMRARLLGSLPSYMVPSSIVALDSLPVTANGKIDRKRLPVPGLLRVSPGAYQEPRDDIERKLVAIYRDVLAVDRIGVEDSFFALGGDSIMSIQASSRARSIGLVLSPSQIFRHQTIAELAPALAAAEAGARMEAGGATDHGHLDVAAAIGPDIEDAYPLTPLQEGLLFHTLSEPHSGVYVMQHRYWIEGIVDVEIFRRAWQAIVDTHSIFRTSFEWEGDRAPRQMVRSSVELPFDYWDWRDLEESEQTSRLERLLAEEREAGFDLREAPLVRIRLLRLRQEQYLLIRSHHHILFDAWCTSAIFQELRTTYAALTNGRNAPVQKPEGFRAYIDWLARQDIGAAESFWRGYLAGFDEPTPLFGRRPNAIAGDDNEVVEDLIVHLSLEDTENLNRVARELRVTPNTFVQTAVALLLARYTSRSEVVFGVTVSGRPVDLPHVENILGLFINGLPLRVAIDPVERLPSLLRRVLEQNFAMRDYEYVSLTKVQDWSETPRGAELFQYLLTYENAPVDASLLEWRDGWRFTDSRHRTHTNYPVTFVVIPGPRLHLQITYARARVEPAAARRLLDDYRRVLEGMVRRPCSRLSEFAAIGDDELRRVTKTWNETGRLHAEPCDIIGRLERQAALRPNAVAATCGDQSLTFGELAQRTDRIARALIEQGVAPDQIVALLDERGLDFLVAMLGIFKAGAGYLPLDPAYPDSRIKQVVEEAEVGWLVAGRSLRERACELLVDFSGAAPRLLDHVDLEACATGAKGASRWRYGPRNLAFVIYTSGSTGRPKGAAVERRGMFNNLITKERALDLTPIDVIAQTASQCFDISVWQFLTPLAIGARVEIFKDEISRDPARLLQEIEARRVTILEAVPSMIQALLDVVQNGRELDSLRWLMPCGEAFAPELCRRVMARFPHLRLLNAYGPAECSDDVSYYPIEEAPGGDDLSVPIGRPVDNTRLYVLDRWLDPAPIGAAGEICVSGVQVGRGYLGRPDLTAAAFLPDPFDVDGGRLYRTGDLGSFRADGVLEFLGRVDHQIKIRGNRIEPGEIQACLLTHPGVREAYVMAQEGSKGIYRLVAYVVGRVSDASLLRDHIVQRLPEFMAPSAFVFLDALPLTPNGKVDRKHLPEREAARLLSRAHTPPRNATEELLCRIWSDVLKVEAVGVDDNFFELGGHSLLAIQVRSRVRQAFDVELSLRVIFEATTVAILAARIEDVILAALDAVTDEEAESLREQLVD